MTLAYQSRESAKMDEIKIGDKVELLEYYGAVSVEYFDSHGYVRDIAGEGMPFDVEVYVDGNTVGTRWFDTEQIRKAGP